MRLHLSKFSQVDPSTFSKQTPKSKHAVLHLLLNLGMRRSLMLRRPLMTPTLRVQHCMVPEGPHYLTSGLVRKFLETLYTHAPTPKPRAANNGKTCKCVFWCDSIPKRVRTQLKAAQVSATPSKSSIYFHHLQTCHRWLRLELATNIALTAKY